MPSRIGRHTTRGNPHVPREKDRRGPDPHRVGRRGDRDRAAGAVRGAARDRVGVRARVAARGPDRRRRALRNRPLTRLDTPDLSGHTVRHNVRKILREARMTLAPASTTSTDEASGRPPIVALDPATGAELGRVPDLGAEDVRALVERARGAQPAWDALGFAGRGRLLKRVQSWVMDHTEELIATVQAETGKVFEDAMIEAGTLAGALAFWTRQAPRYLADERIRSLNPFVLGKRLRVRYVPRAVAGVIAPWNY